MRRRAVGTPSRPQCCNGCNAAGDTETDSHGPHSHPPDWKTPTHPENGLIIFSLVSGRFFAATAFLGQQGGEGSSWPAAARRGARCINSPRSGRPRTGALGALDPSAALRLCPSVASPEQDNRPPGRAMAGPRLGSARKQGGRSGPAPGPQCVRPPGPARPAWIEGTAHGAGGSAAKQGARESGSRSCRERKLGTDVECESRCVIGVESGYPEVG